MEAHKLHARLARTVSENTLWAYSTKVTCQLVSFETILKGQVVKIIKGGLVVDLGVVNAFLPGSQIDIKPVSNFEDYLNKEFEFKIVKFN